MKLSQPITSRVIYRLYPGRPVLVAADIIDTDPSLNSISAWERVRTPHTYAGETSMASIESFVGAPLTAYT